MSGHNIGVIAGCLVMAVILGWVLPQKWRIPAVSLSGAAMLALLSPLAFIFLTLGTGASALVARSPRQRDFTRIFVVAVAAIYGAVLVLNGLGKGVVLGGWVIPFAMGYSTLRLIHYVLEADRGTFASHRIGEVFAYQFFPASLPVGPINRFGDFHKDLRRRRWDPDLFSDGLTRMLVGAAKIVVLGNFLVAQILGDFIAQKEGFGLSYPSTIQFWLSLYVQFSGYTDVAIGAAAALGIRMPENFNYPFVARNIGEFWRRWHITLATWCRDYVYMPVLARSRSTRLAMLAAMLTIGLWHEASLHYVLWGLYHGCGLNLWRSFQARFEPVYERQSATVRAAWNGAAWLLTMNFVILSYPVTNWIEHMVQGPWAFTSS